MTSPDAGPPELITNISSIPQFNQAINLPEATRVDKQPSTCARQPYPFNTRVVGRYPDKTRLLASIQTRQDCWPVSRQDKTVGQ